MDDQIPADKVRKLAARFRQQMEPHTPFAEGMVWERAAEAVESLLPTPPRPTLADMTPEERDACQWMQADLNGYGSRVVIVNPCWDDGSARVMWMHTRIGVVPQRSITPRPDLPRMTWPGDTPAPALPEGWRLADHPDYGRVIVTNPVPDSNGRVYIVGPDDAISLGYDWHSCTPAKLTYIDQDADQ